MQRAQAGEVFQLWGWGRRFGEHRATKGALGGLQSAPLFIMQIIRNEQLEFSRCKKAPRVWRVRRQTPPGITTLSLTSPQPSGWPTPGTKERAKLEGWGAWPAATAGPTLTPAGQEA